MSYSSSMLSLFRFSKALHRPRLGGKAAGRRLIWLTGYLTTGLLIFVVIFGNMQTMRTKTEQQTRAGIAAAEQFMQLLGDKQVTVIQEEVKVTDTHHQSRPVYKVQLVSYNALMQLQLQQKLQNYIQQQNDISHIRQPEAQVLEEHDTNLAAYIHTIERSIERSGDKRWLESGRSLRGSAEIQFDIRRNGRLADLKVLTSSGDSFVDEQLLTSVRQAAPFPSVPITILQPGEEAIRLVRWLSFIIESGH